MAQKKHAKQTYQRGVSAEYLAALWLQMKGYKILARRYKTTYGEIDLIAQSQDVIAFIEVKARPTKAQALESITPAMRRRITNAALHYISENDASEYDLRFDVLTVLPITLKTLREEGFFIHHLDNAWMAGA